VITRDRCEQPCLSGVVGPCPSQDRLRFLVGGIAVQCLAVGEPGHVGAGEARDRESQAQDHPASGQSRVALGVVVEDGADRR